MRARAGADTHTHSQIHNTRTHTHTHIYTHRFPPSPFPPTLPPPPSTFHPSLTSQPQQQHTLPIPRLPAYPRISHPRPRQPIYLTFCTAYSFKLSNIDILMESHVFMYHAIIHKNNKIVCLDMLCGTQPITVIYSNSIFLESA